MMLETTKDIKIPKDPIERVIGQDNAVSKVKLAIRQRRHLLLVGPPGIGKSMLAMGLAAHLPKPRDEVSVVHNPKNENRPLLEVRSRGEIMKGGLVSGVRGRVVAPTEVPTFVAERLGFRCSSCGDISSSRNVVCPRCGAAKRGKLSRGKRLSPFGDIITEIFEIGTVEPEIEVQLTYGDNAKKTVVYQRIDETRIRIVDKDELESSRKSPDRKLVNTILPLNRQLFVGVSGASETELLGDIRHDPYGGHPQIGTPAYLRVVPGAIHEAHEGVLFVDEISHLGHLQNYVLTALQEKKFPIVGRNPHSAGASVKVNDVPCDFIFVGACNIGELESILPPLRSRILGNGYEILLNTTMPDNSANRDKLVRFIAQEIEKDGRIPHANRGAMGEIVAEAKKKAKEMDNARDALTLRLRDLGGIVRLAGDLAVDDGSKVIEKKHVKRAISEAKSIEHQLFDRYGSVWSGLKKDEPYLEHGGADGYV